MNRKKPDTYQEWRAEYQLTARQLGWHIHFNIRQGRPLMDRITWELHHRTCRLWLRLRVESEACTESYCEEVLRALRERY